MKLKEIKTSLLDLLPVIHDIGIEHVPEKLSLRPGLVKIVVTKTKATSKLNFNFLCNGHLPRLLP